MCSHDRAYTASLQEGRGDGWAGVSRDFEFCRAYMVGVAVSCSPERAVPSLTHVGVASPLPTKPLALKFAAIPATHPSFNVALVRCCPTYY